MANATHALIGLPAAIMSVISSYTYVGIFLLMTLESASLPIPSEIILPAAGALSASGAINIWLALLVALAGGIIGMMIDYYIAYYIGKDVVYKHLGWFRIKRKTLESFDAWFRQNGPFAVFISRLIPLVRGLISFPAGFAKMPKAQFLAYSFSGTLIWDVALLLFGYYAIHIRNVDLLFAAIAVFVIVLYAIYALAFRRIRAAGKKSSTRKKR